MKLRILIFAFILCSSITVTAYSQSAKTVLVEMNASYIATQNIQLAPETFFVIEFPPDDEIKSVIPTDKLLVKMDDSFLQSQETRLPIILRAGPNWGEKSQTSVLVLMQSGAMLQLKLVPSNIETSVERISWRYDVENIETLRQQVLSLKNSVDKAATSLTVSTNSPVTASDRALKIALSDLETIKGVPSIPTNFSLQSAKNSDFEIYAQPSRWVESGNWTQTTLAVKNINKSANLQLVSPPRLLIENRNQKGKSVNVQNYPTLSTQSNLPMENPIILRPGDVAYFSLVYETPYLGTDQTLKVLVMQTNAANNPAYAIITPGGLTAVKQKK